MELETLADEKKKYTSDNDFKRILKINNSWMELFNFRILLNVIDWNF